MGVDDTSRRAFEDCVPSENIGFSGPGFVERDEVSGDANGLGKLMSLVELLVLLIILSEDPFPALPIWYSLLLAQVIHQPLSLEAQRRFERGRAIV